jgi:uncharacterized membrane protein (DUF4010 family)
MEQVPSVHFVPFDIAAKLLVSLGIGLLVGFEREWARKDLGVRTFALVSLLGMITSLESQSFALVGMAAVIALVTMLNLGNLQLRRDLELTTSAALVVTFALGVLVGQGHVFTPTAAAVLMTLLLALKPQLTRFAGGVTADEVRGAVVLGLIGFVIYPILPDRPVDPWRVVNPREAWLTVVLIAGIGFINYVLLRVYSTRGFYYTAVFGGLVNSTAAVAELAGSIGTNDPGSGEMIITVTLLTVIAMFVRNLVLLAIFSPAAGFIAVWPILAMCLFTAAFTFRHRPRAVAPPQSGFSSPISVRRIASFGLFFLAIEASATMGQRWFGEAATIMVSFLGGFVSSASSTAAAGSLTAHRQISVRSAAICTILASTASTLVNLPIIYRTARRSGVLQRLIVVSVMTTAIGLAVLTAVLFLV